jgi:leader peptidase (prepilin peptidase)/N-methyltransferase
MGLISTAVAVAGSLAFLLTGMSLPFASWSVLFLLLLWALALIDLTTETVPDSLTYALVVSGLTHTLVAGWPLAPSLVGSVLLLALGHLHGYVTSDKGWIGSGDFFLAAGLIAWFGPLLLLDVLALGSIFLVLHGLVVRQSSIALAPSLAVAATLIWFQGVFL